jgi:hypothetical protein
MSQSTSAALPGLSPVCGKPLIARFDGGQLSSDAGVLALREIESRLGVADRLAACVAVRALRGISSMASPTFCASGC